MSGPSVTESGLVVQDRDEILGEIFDLFRRYFGPEIDLSTQSPDRHVADITTDRELNQHGALSLLVDGFQIDSASGVMLDWLGQRLGARLRNPATRAEGDDVAFCGSAAVLVPVGHVFRQSLTEDTAETTDSATLAALTAWATATGYTAGQMRKNGGDAFVCSESGTSAGAGPGPVEPSPSTAEITDGTAKWLWVGTGEYGAVLSGRATDYGAFSPTAGSFDENVSTVGNLTGIRNASDWTSGTDLETDAEYRIAIRQSLRGRRGTLGAIARAVASLDFVESFLVRTNRTGSVDADGDPGHSAHVILSDPLTLTDAQKLDVIEALADVWPAGIECVGTDFRGDVVITCTNGVIVRVDNEIGADFATLLRVYCKVEITYIASAWPSDGADQIKALLNARVFSAGEECRPNTLETEITDAVPGIADITVKLSTTVNPPTTRQRINADDTEVIDIATADITVTETVET